MAAASGGWRITPRRRRGTVASRPSVIATPPRTPNRASIRRVPLGKIVLPGKIGRVKPDLLVKIGRLVRIGPIASGLNGLSAAKARPVRPTRTGRRGNSARPVRQERLVRLATIALRAATVPPSPKPKPNAGMARASPGRRSCTTVRARRVQRRSPSPSGEPLSVEIMTPASASPFAASRSQALVSSAHRPSTSRGPGDTYALCGTEGGVGGAHGAGRAF